MMKAAMMDKVYAVLPAFNEQGKIGRVVEKIKKTGTIKKIIVVDDFSTDETSGEAKAAGAEVLRHEKNMGVGAAIRTGINYGLENKYDICTILSGDDQHEPQELKRVIGPIMDNDFDFIQGSRRMAGGRVVNDRPFRMITTQLYSLLFSILVGRRITDATNGFRAFRLNIFQETDFNIEQDWLDRYELEPYILYKACRSNQIRLKEVPITIYYHGDSKQYTKMRPVHDWWRLARPMIFLALKLRK